QPTVQVQVYAADHGFNCDQRGSYDAAAAQLAHERSAAFLSQHLA
ncbi:MAG: dienelactone hydrolase family protein, partial [Inhella sp.]